MERTGHRTDFSSHLVAECSRRCLEKVIMSPPGAQLMDPYEVLENFKDSRIVLFSVFSNSNVPQLLLCLLPVIWIILFPQTVFSFVHQSCPNKDPKLACEDLHARKGAFTLTFWDDLCCLQQQPCYTLHQLKRILAVHKSRIHLTFGKLADSCSLYGTSAVRSLTKRIVAHLFVSMFKVLLRLCLSNCFPHHISRAFKANPLVIIPGMCISCGMVVTTGTE